MDEYKVLDRDGTNRSLAIHRQGGIDRPVHHSEVICLQVEKTRPANTTAYIAGDVIGDGTATPTMFLFDAAAAGIPAGLIIGARLIRDSTAAPTTRFRLGVHDALPAVIPAADNDAAPMLYANRASRRGWVDFQLAMQGVAAGSNCLEYVGALSHAQGIPFNAADGILRIILSAVDGFTPASGEKFTIELDIIA